MKPLRSRKYLDGSRGQTCKFNIPGVCRGETETVVACHIRDSHAGRSQKASDLSVVDGCLWCHNVMDRRSKMPNGQLITDWEWTYYALRGLQLTLEARVHAKVLGWPEDRHSVTSAKPAKKTANPSRQFDRPKMKKPWAKRPMQRKTP